MHDLTISLIQADLAWEERERNFDRFARLLGEVAGMTDLALLPETFNTGFSINPDAFAEPMEGPSVRFLREMARTTGAAVAGTLLVRDGGRCFNRFVCAYPDGSLATYDKRHLFRLSEEFRLFSAGGRQVILDVKGWKVAPIVCYDLRFPVWSKNTWNDGQYGYDLLLCPANWPASRANIWKTLLAARAIENQAYMAGVNRIGNDGHGTGHSGDSRVIDAKGNILGEAAANLEEVLTVTLSATELKLYREAFTVGMDWDRFEIGVRGES